MSNREFQEAMRSGHFPISTSEAFQILLARSARTRLSCKPWPRIRGVAAVFPTEGHTSNIMKLPAMVLCVNG
ncbi:hypothetical protein J2X72_004340 [Phyllobacterium sp. 1468]|nr:hypothetical protein [Phyllobacterium sp. 1468]